VLLRAVKYLAIAVGVIVALIAGLLALSYAFPPTYKAAVDLPGTSSTVGIELEPMHLYLAEYQRTLVLRSPGTADVRIKMFPDTGGYARAQLYRLSDGRFSLRGFFDAYVIDPRALTISEEKGATRGGSYLGAFDDRGHEWRFNEAAVSPEQSLKVESN
jgi:hypothetical protein